MVLHSERKRRAARDAQEAAGASLWTEEVPQEARVKIATIWSSIRGSLTNAAGYEFDERVGKILRVLGGYNAGSVDPNDLVRQSDSDVALDLIGAACIAIREGAAIARHYDSFEKFINRTFEDYRIGFRVVDAEVIPIGSDELHAEVVAPALRLLVDKDFEKAHKAYLDAIKEIPKDPANAITDAGTALQETLEVLGCEGNSLGSLIKSGKKKGLLARHDARLEAGIKEFLEWASADRSETGDGHHVTAATREDAWLMVHIVGALIVRLVGGGKRGELDEA